MVKSSAGGFANAWTHEMDRSEPYGAGYLALALLIPLILRLSPILFEIPIGRDIAEYECIARNLAEGRRACVRPRLSRTRGYRDFLASR